MRLEQHEIDSAIWKKIKADLEQRLALCRAQNDGDQDPIKTANLRGRIADIKATLSLGEPQPELPSN
jgi:hypothetical protein